MTTTNEPRLTRLSLVYPISYLLPSGTFLMIAPRTALKLFLSNADYGDVLPRLSGILIVGLGLIVLQIVRKKQSELYATLLWVRVFFCAGWLGLWLKSADPFFLFLLGVVGLGVLLTGAAKLADRRKPVA